MNKCHECGKYFEVDDDVEFPEKVVICYACQTTQCHPVTGAGPERRQGNVPSHQNILTWETNPKFKESEFGEYWWFHPSDWRISPEPQIVLVRVFRGSIRAFYLAGGIEKVREMRGLWAGPVMPPVEDQLCGLLFGITEAEAQEAWQRFITEHMRPSRLLLIAMELGKPTEREEQHLKRCAKCRSVIRAYRESGDDEHG